MYVSTVNHFATCIRSGNEIGMGTIVRSSIYLSGLMSVEKHPESSITFFLSTTYM